MEVREFLEKRKSTREYSRKKLSSVTANELKMAINRANDITKDHGATFRLYEDGKKIGDVLDGHAGYDGVMIKSPAYISLSYDVNDTEATIYGAFYLEHLSTIADRFDLGHCWITLQETPKDIKKAVFDDHNEEVHYLLAIGHPARKFRWGAQEFSSRIGIESFVYKNEIGNSVDIDFLDQLGLKDIFYYIRFAPSTRNKQPWCFVIKENENIIDLYLKDDGQADYSVDIGIMMFYFQSLASFSGIPADFELVEADETNGYRLMARTKF